MALIVASVPELTSRTFSTEGTAAMISSASSFSASVGAPKLVPRRTAASSGRHDRRMGVAEDHRSPGADVIEVAIAVDIDQVGPFGVVDEDRLAADAAERPGGAVHSPGDELFGAGEGGVALLAGHGGFFKRKVGWDERSEVPYASS